MKKLVKILATCLLLIAGCTSNKAMFTTKNVVYDYPITYTKTITYIGDTYTGDSVYVTNDVLVTSAGLSLTNIGSRVSTLEDNNQTSITFDYNTNNFTSAGWQEDIDSLGKYIDYGYNVVFQFTNGTYSITNAMVFSGFYGGGDIRVRDTGVSTAQSTNQVVILDGASLSGSVLNFRGNHLDRTYTQGMRINCNSDAGYHAVSFTGSSGNNIVQGCWFVGNGYTSGASSAVNFNCAFGHVQNGYISNVEYGMISQYGAHALCNGVDDWGTQPKYGLRVYGGIIMQNGNQPNGSTADEDVNAGGLIQ